jgi:hypothetical protein
MNSIAIYVEGGGDTTEQRKELRIGLDELLREQKQKAQAKRLRWKTVPCGGRQLTYEAFVYAVNHSDDSICILLIDSEEEAPAELQRPKNESSQARAQRLHKNAQIRKTHLVNRDNWDLKNISPECIHLMVRCMEAWIVSDPEALGGFYGQGFRAKDLPVRVILEDEPKAELYEKLARATKGTSKGVYLKIKHASKLLGLVDPVKVATRCPRFATFISWLDEQISDA